MPAPLQTKVRSLLGVNTGAIATNVFVQLSGCAVIVPPTGEGEADASDTETIVEVVHPLVPVITQVYVPACKNVTALLVAVETPEDGLHE